MFNFFKKKVKEQTINNEIRENQKDFNNINIIYEYLEARTGLYFKTSSEHTKIKIINFCNKEAISSFNELLILLKDKNDLWLQLVDLLSINESYFYRETNQILEVLNHYKKIDKDISILCAPSSTGEEAYTIALLMLENGYTSDNINILGIDISISAIEKAKKGVYNSRSIHRVPKDILSKYFSIHNNMYTIDNILKENINFQQYNIYDKNILNIGKFDIIFSRNMFIYFNEEKKREAYDILNKLKKNNQSRVCLGHADISSSLSSYINNR